MAVAADRYPERVADDRDRAASGRSTLLTSAPRRVWIPWAAALLLTAIAAGSVSEILKVPAGLVIVVAALAGLPLGFIATRPVLGWSISVVGAITVANTFEVIDGDPWPWPEVHGLVLLASLFAVCLMPYPRLSRTGQVILPGLATATTALVFAYSVPADITAGWALGVVVIGVTGVLVRMTGRVQLPPATTSAVPLSTLQANVLAGFREAFMAWVPSPPTGRPFAQRLLGRHAWGEWAHGVMPWVLAFAVFWIGVASIPETLDVHDLILPVLAALMALPIGLSRHYALLGWRLTTLLAIIIALVGTPSGGADPGTWPAVMWWVWLVVTFLVSVRHDRWTTLWAWLATVGTLSAGTADNAGVAVTLIVATSALMLIGDLLRTRRLASREAERQTELSALEKARRTVLEERTRIARDLHDVVAHHMSMVVVQAETAPYRVPELSDDAKAEFTAISSSARQALTEIRGMLGVLRSDDHAVLTAPQPGLAEVAELVDNVAGSGVDVTLRTIGTPRPVSAAAELSAYRIAQESLANAARHSPGSAVTVEVGYGDDSVRLSIINTAPPAPAEPALPGPPGHGVIGMRERASVVGGSLRAAPLPDGGYEVVAEIPTIEEPSGDTRADH